MGVMSRKVVPVCGSLCFLCPSLRARSRQPVKRYKKLLGEILPKSQDGDPNERKIGKLCEYAAKNPLRIPKITELLEQRFYKDMRTEQFNSIKVVVSIYQKLLFSCKEHMPLFANSFLGIMRTLLDQEQQDDLRILGCNSLVNFINCQRDNSYIFNLEGLVSKLCHLAHEFSEDAKGPSLISAGLQSLAVLVCYMGEYSRLLLDFNNIVLVTLDNYGPIERVSVNLEKNNSGNLWVKEITKVDIAPPLMLNHSNSLASSLDTVCGKEASDMSMVEFVRKEASEVSTDVFNSPKYWSRICLQSLAKVAKEATTLRHFLEPLFRYFDNGNHWSPDHGLAISIFSDIQLLMEKNGQITHFLAILVNHLDHKKIAKQPSMQVKIATVISQVVKQSKIQPTVELFGAVSDLMRHIRKCFQQNAELSQQEDERRNMYVMYQHALEDCLIQFCRKMADAGPLLDIMAGMLENMSCDFSTSRPTISAIYRTVQLISSCSNITFDGKAFPEALFQQLLLAMLHPDHITQIGAHHIFSAVYMPSSIHSWPLRELEECQRQFLETTSRPSDISWRSSEWNLSADKADGNCDGKAEKCALQLSSHQMGLLLSSIWSQAISPENTPMNFEAIAHTYSLVLSSQAKDQGRDLLVRNLQLAFSLRKAALAKEGCLRPSQRRSLFTFAMSMLLFLAKAYKLDQLVSLVKDLLSDEEVDPYLSLVNDQWLQAYNSDPYQEGATYGSENDEILALKFLSRMENKGLQFEEVSVSVILSSFENLSEDQSSGLRQQLLEEFSPDDGYSIGAPLFMETPHPCSPFTRRTHESFDEAIPSLDFFDDEPLLEVSGSQSDGRTSISTSSCEILNVSQLINSVLETARQVASIAVPTMPIPYEQMKKQCEALVVRKQKKMSVLSNSKHQKNVVFIDLLEDRDTNRLMMSYDQEKSDAHKESFESPVSERYQTTNSILCSAEYLQSFRLPPASPYDKFLKTVGCA